MVLRTSTLGDELLVLLWALLDCPDFRAGVEALGGYSCVETGRRIRCRYARARPGGIENVVRG